MENSCCSGKSICSSGGSPDGWRRHENAGLCWNRRCRWMVVVRGRIWACAVWRVVCWPWDCEEDWEWKKRKWSRIVFDERIGDHGLEGNVVRFAWGFGFVLAAASSRPSQAQLQPSVAGSFASVSFFRGLVRAGFWSFQWLEYSADYGHQLCYRWEPDYSPFLTGLKRWVSREWGRKRRWRRCEIGLHLCCCCQDQGEQLFPLSSNFKLPGEEAFCPLLVEWVSDEILLLSWGRMQGL